MARRGGPQRRKAYRGTAEHHKAKAATLLVLFKQWQRDFDLHVKAEAPGGNPATHRRICEGALHALSNAKYFGHGYSVHITESHEHGTNDSVASRMTSKLRLMDRKFAKKCIR